MIPTMQKMLTEVAKEKVNDMGKELGNKIPDFSKSNETSTFESKIPSFYSAEKGEPEQPTKNIEGNQGADQVDKQENDEAVTATDKSVRVIETRNSSLDGDLHPISGVEFEYKIVKDESGEDVGGVFPKFESAFDAQLSDELLDKSDKKQFDSCNDQLKEAFEHGELDTSTFSDRQVDQMKNGDKPEGYTWHHHEETGKMQLIETDVHDKTGHTGGKSVWGGGSNAR